MNGILLVNKDASMTSRDVVNVVSKVLKTKKIGHTGTLDPLATGVLVLCCGNCSKLAELITATEKEYIADMIFGIETDTLDNTGTILKEEEVNITKEEIINTLSSFVGSYQQEVPAYSAVKINGRKLYEYARNGEKIDLPKRLVTIKYLELIEEPYIQDKHIHIKFKTLVSKGTYIRSLIRDIAFKLNTVGIMEHLKRTKQGEFLLEDCYTLDDIRENNYQLMSKEQLFENEFKVIMDEQLNKKVSNGQILETMNHDITLFTNKEGIIKAIYKVDENDSNIIRPWKMFLD